LSEVNNTNKWTSHPRRDECLRKVGLPGWFDGDPMSPKPQQ